MVGESYNVGRGLLSSILASRHAKEHARHDPVPASCRVHKVNCAMAGRRNQVIDFARRTLPEGRQNTNRLRQMAASKLSTCHGRKARRQGPEVQSRVRTRARSTPYLRADDNKKVLLMLLPKMLRKQLRRGGRYCAHRFHDQITSSSFFAESLMVLAVLILRCVLMRTQDVFLCPFFYPVIY